MKWNDLTLRVGVLAVMAAMLLRFAGSGIFGNAIGIFAQPEIASFLIYSETGRLPSLPSPGPSSPPSTAAPTDPTAAPTDPPSTTVPPIVPIEPGAAVFSEADAQYVKFNYSCALRPDYKKLLLQKLTWDLTSDKPTVLIVHSHGTEAYTKTPDANYVGHAAFRTTDDRYNMISIGDELTRLLEAAGIHVIHDRTAHDYLDYDNAYENSRKAVQAYLKEYPSIKLVLDVHRDSLTNSDGSQVSTSATVNGKPSAQLMYVSGSNASAVHPNWQKNLSLIEKLHVVTEKAYPGVTRPINLRAKAYNQDLSVGSLLVEVGSAGNTHPEAMNAVPALAEAIIALAKGAG